MKIRAKKKNILKDLRERRSHPAWVPPGQEVVVGGYRIPDGMVYAGSGLKAVKGEGREAALLDPFLPCASEPAGQMPWMLFGVPTYDRLAPGQRTEYLKWLAGGRSAPEVQDFCLLLFFLGIERRILHDTQTGRVPAAEILALIGETERLLRLYSHKAAFAQRAGSFLPMARMIARDYRPEPLEAVSELLAPSTIWEVGPALFAAAGRPLSPAWAFAVWRHWREARHGRALADCPDLVRELFVLRYPEKLPRGGFPLFGRGRPAQVRYLPLNPGLSRLLQMTLEGIEEHAVLSSHLEWMQELVDQVSAELAPYRRWIARKKDGSSPAALALLPPELAGRQRTEESRRLEQWIEETLAGRAWAPVRCEEVALHWPMETAGAFTKRSLEAFAAFLERSGLGVVPDPRRREPLPKTALVLFRLHRPSADGAEQVSAAGEAAAVVLQLAVEVAAADGAVDPRQERHLLEHVEEAAHLGPAERTRLQAWLGWLLAEPQGLLGAEKKLASFSGDRCRAVARFLLTIAGADGHVSPEEIRQLKRIYRVLRLDPDSLYADIHAVLAGAEPGEAASGDRLALDVRKIKDKLAETVQVSALLGEIFEEDDGAASAPAPAVEGLDASHATLLQTLAGRSAWERASFEEHAAALGLLPEGALEMLNEAAFQLCGVPLLEDGETLEIDAEVLREMLA